MSKFLLIQNDTVLSFKTKNGRDRYALNLFMNGGHWMSVDIGTNFYTVFNPYIKGSETEKTVQFYNFETVLKYCASFI